MGQFENISYNSEFHAQKQSSGSWIPDDCFCALFAARKIDSLFIYIYIYIYIYNCFAVNPSREVSMAL